MNEVTQDLVLSKAYKCQDALIAYAYTILRDWSLSQDAVQEALIAANNQWREFETDAEIFPWLKRITRNKAIDIIRRRKRTDYVADEEMLSLVDVQFDRQFDVTTAAEGLEQRRKALQICMDKLDSKSLSLMMGFYREREACATLADRFHKSVNAVRLSISRLRMTLRACAEKQLKAVEQP